MADTSTTAAPQAAPSGKSQLSGFASYFCTVIRLYAERRALISELERIPEAIRQDVGISPTRLKELRYASLFVDRG